jgi:hypothetical protein
MTRRPAQVSGGRTALVVLAGVAVAIASSGCPAAPTERAAPETSAARTQPGPPVTEGVALTPTVIAVEESSATYEVPIAAPPAAAEGRPVEAAPPVEDRPADSPKRCLTLQVSPSSASAYGIQGEVVQLVVRARNGCSTNFGSATFRVTAIGPDGRELGSAVGSFSVGIAPFGSAETLIAIPTKPSLALTYRAEVMGY